jgi:hypothetical protein
MTNRSPIVNNFPLDRSYYYPLDADGAAIPVSKALSAAQVFTIKVDLNGTSNIKFYIGEEANANNIGGFNLTVNFYEETGKIITGSAQTVAVPATTKNTNQYVDITGLSYIETANYAIISGTIPYTNAITVTFFAKGIYETAIDDLSTVLGTIDSTMADVESAIGTLVGTTANVSSAVATLNSTLSAVIYVDGNPFTYSASKTLSMAGVINPTRTNSDGDVVPIAVDDIGQVRSASFDFVNTTDRVTNTFPHWEHFVFETLANVTNGADGTYSYYIDMEGFNRLGLSILAGASTGSFMGGTKTYTGSAIDTFGNGEGSVDHFKYIKVTVVATATATADWLIRSKAWTE